MNHHWLAMKQSLHLQSVAGISRHSALSSLTGVWRQMTSMWCFSVSDWKMLHFASDNPSTLTCIIHRAGPTAWKSRSALLEGSFLALWPGSTGIPHTGGIFSFPRLCYSLRYLQGGRCGRRLPSLLYNKWQPWISHTGMYWSDRTDRKYLCPLSLMRSFWQLCKTHTHRITLQHYLPLLTWLQQQFQWFHGGL